MHPVSLKLLVLRLIIGATYSIAWGVHISMLEKGRRNVLRSDWDVGQPLSKCDMV
jgi:hypothetical protein